MSRRADLILVRYGELALKGKNRGSFESKLVQNMIAATGRREVGGELRFLRERGRILVEPKGELAAAERTSLLTKAARRLQEVPGITSLSLCTGVERTLDAISAAVNAELREHLEFARGRTTFRISSRRADKKFELTSVELDRQLAERIPPELWDKLAVDLKTPELELGVEVRVDRAFVHTGSLPGTGGLPVGSLGRTLCLLSGGIDSPVAAWYAMKRGCRTDMLSFLSPPYIGAGTRSKLVELTRALSRFQPRTTLYLAPFTEVQESIRDLCPAPYRTILYRRFMQRIGSKLARRRRIKALVTGESIGQVASQTLDNIYCIEAAADVPVLRPLIGFDKQEAVDVAKRIGTYDLSNRPEPDCCTVFMPETPMVHGKLEDCLAAEDALDVDGLVLRSLKGIEKVTFEAGEESD